MIASGLESQEPAGIHVCKKYRIRPRTHPWYGRSCDSAAGRGANPHSAVSGMGRLFLQVGRQHRLLRAVRADGKATGQRRPRRQFLHRLAASGPEHLLRAAGDDGLYGEGKFEDQRRHRQQDLRDVHQGQGRLGRERGSGAGPRRSDEDRSFDDGQCRLAQGHGHLLQLFAFGHLGGAEADRKLQVSGLPTAEFRRGRPCAGPCRFYL
ncbi:hypothetical protein RHECNPAF_44600100 [Rhizobium etli CNPAF512]|nr:hypothetical protein RHECNPAF_44600100 [Rhizobium etli CNPAF512]